MRVEKSETRIFPLALLAALAAASLLDDGAFSVLLPEIRDTFRLSNAATVLIGTLQGALLLIASVPVAHLGDQTKRLWLVRSGALLWVAAVIMTGVTWPLGIFVLVRVLSGAGKIVTGDLTMSLLSDYYPPKKLPLAISVQQNAAIAGLLVSGPIAGWLFRQIGDWRPIFPMLAVPTVIVLIVSLRLREPQKGAFSDLPAEAMAEKITLPEAYRRLRSILTLRRVWVAAFLFGAAVLPLPGLISLFFKDVYEIGSVGRGIISGVGTGAYMAGLAIGGLAARRVMNLGSYEWLMKLAGAFVVGYGFFIFAMATAPWLALSIAMLVLTNLCGGALIPPYLAAVGSITSPRMRTLGYAFTSIWIALGGLLLAQLVLDAGGNHTLRFSIGFLALFVVAGGAVGLTAAKFVRRDIDQVAQWRSAETASSEAQLLIQSLEAGYDNRPVLFGVSLEVRQGELMALLGTNGAGKSTLLNSIAGSLDPVGGAIFFEGRDITHADEAATTTAGIVTVPSGRSVFPNLTVQENLRAASWLNRLDRAAEEQAVAAALEKLPALGSRLETTADKLSGGERQMLNLAMALVRQPRMLLVDELSLGLSPRVVGDLLEVIQQINKEGTTVIFVEQSVTTALKIAGRAIFLERGEVRYDGPASKLKARKDLLRSIYIRTSRRKSVKGDQVSSNRDVVLEVSGLTKRFSTITAVDGLDLLVRKGEVAGIVGPNGAGKTTVLDLVSGYLLPDEGTIELLGQDVTSASVPARAKAGLGRSFQSANLWPALTVRESLALASERQAEVKGVFPSLFKSVALDSERVLMEEADRLIDLLGLGDFQNKFVGELSTGLRRLVEIGVLAASGASLLLLDEPSSGLAQKETEALPSLLKDLREATGASMLIVEHHIPLITEVSDRLIFMAEGAVLREGNPREVMKDRTVVESYLG